MNLPLYDDSGKNIGNVDVSKNVFDVPFNEGLVHQMLVLQQANGRKTIAKAKTRGEVRGGGRKPHKQKGTGRARSGSIRNPIWRGGGVVFGPTGTENYSKNMPQKQRKIALTSVLSEKVRYEEVLILDKYNVSEVKTKLFAALIANLPVEKSVLFVVPDRNEVIWKSAKNIPNVRILQASYLNVSDILYYKFVVFFQDSLPIVDKIFAV